MTESIRVHVIDYGRKSLYMRYRDPITDKHIAQSTGTKNRRKADRIAAKWEADLQTGRTKHTSKIGWTEFREKYDQEKIPSLAESTATKIDTVFNAVEKYLNPKKLIDITAERISYYQSRLRSSGSAETTIKGHLAHLKAALNWAKRIGLLQSVPEIEMPRRAKKTKVMKGRPITQEEFERMLEAIPKVVGEGITPSWRHYLYGLWWSGLRLKESLELWWDRDDKICIDETGKYTMLRIPAELEKGNQDRLLPIAPEFASFLRDHPHEQRTGRVFDPQPIRPERSHGLCDQQVGRLVCRIGKIAGVKVHNEPTTGKVKYASAHDLRRSFGERWAVRVMPQVLKELMRHESIETTMRYYVGRNAETTAEALYAAVSGNNLGNTNEIPVSERANPFQQTESQ